MKGKIAVVLVLVAVIATNVFFWNSIYSTNIQTNYNFGMEQGKTLGYQDGYNAGKNDGWANGNNTGYQDGRLVGYDEGYTLGKADGNQSGFTQGHTLGVQDGYVQGLKDGAGTGYNIRDPSYQEMNNFLATETVHNHAYNNDSYDCFNFASDFAEEAFNAGYKCALVYLTFADGNAHMLNAFSTTDKGLIYVEPQIGIAVTLTVGQPFTVDTPQILYQFDSNVNIASYTVVW